MKIKNTGFSLIEISMILLIIGVMVAGTSVGISMLSKSRLGGAAAATNSSPVKSINGLALWLETTSDSSFASDSAGNTIITPQNGDAIVTWRDIGTQKLSKLNVTQGVSTKRPIFTHNIANGLPALKFDGTDDTLSAVDTSGLDLKLSDQLTIFVVLMAANAGNNSYIPISKNENSTPNYKGWELWQGDTKEFRFDISNAWAGNAISNLTTTTTADKSWHIVGIRYNGGGAVNSIDIFKDGAEISSDSNSFSANSLTASPSSSVGLRISGREDPSDNSVSAFYNGYIAEIIVFEKTLTQYEFDDVFKYLGRKFNIKVTTQS